MARARRAHSIGGELSAQPKPNPLRERDRIKQEMQAAYDEYSQQTRFRQAAERERAAAQRELDAVEGARAKGKGTDDELSAAELRLATAKAAYSKALARSNRALSIQKALEYELTQLYSAYFEAFAEEAEKASKLADAAVNELVAVYRRAQEAWAQAQTQWTALCHSVRIANMAPFPLNDHIMAPVVNGWCARPPGIEVLDMEPGECVEEVALLEGLDVAG